MINQEDLVIWPDGAMCFGEELEEMLQGRSDDFRVVKIGTDEWYELTDSEQSEYDSDDYEDDWDDTYSCGCCKCCGCYCDEPTDRFGNPKEGWEGYNEED